MKRAHETLGMCLYFLIVIPALIFTMALSGCAPEYTSTYVEWEETK